MLQKMTRGSRILEFSYDANGTPDSIKYRSSATATPTYYYYALNSRGDVVALYSSTGAVTALYEYDAYGNVTVKSTNGQLNTSETHIANLNPLRYRGYVYDNETGFYYLQSRYYDPSTCRFINADGYTRTGQGILGNNMFAYCNNNPVLYLDSAGYRPVVGDNVQNESAAERKLSCGYMKGDTTPVVDLTEALNEEMTKNAEDFRSCINAIQDGPQKTIVVMGIFAMASIDGGKYDLKLQDEWKFDENAKYTYGKYNLRYDDVGNIHYGYVGSVYFSEDFLCFAAGVNQFFKDGLSYGIENNFDDPRDQIMVRIGCTLYEEELLW